MDLSTLRFVDISMPLENGVKSDPDISRPKIDYMKHDESIARIQTFFPDLKAEELPDAAGWAVEKVQISTHNGTHLDAPYHFHPTMNHASGKPEPSWTIDQVPLEWCFRPGVKLDFRHFGNGFNFPRSRTVCYISIRQQYNWCHMFQGKSGSFISKVKTIGRRTCGNNNHRAFPVSAIHCLK